ncbi:MAG: 6-carboxytetrahydropterin synthase [Gemmatimonadota bacterium]|jgi:6-pyruvoyltetrahydropterin/6-carboxytetrahydropterin synthase|nr:MAG: 6-carboxytetrahydropterin synthase [Gemmatimonadota bacterium]
MPKVRVTRRLHFAAGHRLHNPAFDDERNQAVFGACSNPQGHGHNYEIEVTVEGEVDPETGYVLDVKRLRDLVNDRVVGEMDHANLNVDVAWLQGVNPTAENLAVQIWNRLVGHLDGVRLVSVRLWETPRNLVEYCGE